MCKCIHRGLFCRHLVVLLLWLWNVSFLGNLNLKGVLASSSINTSHAVVPSRSAPNPVGEFKESKSVSFSLHQTTSNPRNQELADDEEFPLWIIVLIIVTVGLIVIACILCLIRFHRWKNDHGTYSMWNSHEPSVEAMYARESGVLFERLDIETSLAEAQCYEIPVDSFQAPQRIYIDGIRVTPLVETVEESDTKQSEVDGEIHVIDGTQYCPAKDSTMYSNDSAGQRESLPSSSGPDTSQRSSVSTTTVSDRGLTPGHETSGTKELYPKALPVIPLEDTSVVLCETYQLDVDDDGGRVSALVNRPLPQTPPHLAPPPVVYSAASLDRTLLKQQKAAMLDKPNTFRTLPRPRKIRQIPLPFFNAITRSASSTDVNKETERLSDHVASDPKKCTLTRVKKRLSQSLDTLMASQRVSHFYENPYSTQDGTNRDKESIPGTKVNPPYSRVSSCTTDENLSKDKEHLYTRISQYMEGQGSNMNRHSYASIHYPSFRSRPKSKHVYISIIFGSAESVFIPSIDNPNNNVDSAKLTRTRSKSCPTLNSSTRQPNSDANTKYSPRPHSYFPPNDASGLYCIDARNGSPQVLNGINNDLISFPDSQYQNIRESLGISPLLKTPLPTDSMREGVISSNGYQNLQESMNTLQVPSPNSGEAGVYKTPTSLDIRPYYENITCVKDGRSWNGERKDHVDTSHYGVPKSPAIPLQRVREILDKTSGGNGEGKSLQRALEDDGSLEIFRRKRSVDNEKCAKNGERETFSTYLEGRFNDAEYIEQIDTINREAEGNETSHKDHKGDSNEPMYENYISTNREICTSEKSGSSLDHLSLSSSLSIDDKEIYENQPLIPKTSDVNGNSVCDGFVEKLEVRKNSLAGSNLFGESVA